MLIEISPNLTRPVCINVLLDQYDSSMDARVLSALKAQPARGNSLLALAFFTHFTQQTSLLTILVC